MHEDLGMRKVCARWIPRLLTVEQKERRVEIAEEHRNSRTFLLNGVKGGENVFNVRENILRKNNCYRLVCNVEL